MGFLWLVNRALKFDVFYEQLAINGLIQCPLTSAAVFRLVYLLKNSSAASAVSGDSTPLHSVRLHVPVPRTKFCRFKFAQFVNTQLPFNFAGWESFLARGRRQPGDRCPLSARAAAGAEHQLSQRSSAQPWLPSLRGSLLLYRVFAAVQLVGRAGDKKRFPRLEFRAFFSFLWLSGWLMWIGKYCWPI